MIFDQQTIELIQKAIENRDEAFFYERLEPKPREPKSRFIRSALMVSANNARHLNKLDELECDAAIVNLEDAVAPPFKKIALLAAALFIQNAPDNGPMLVVRTNPLPEAAEEIELLNRFFPDAIRLPKIRNAQEVQEALEMVDEKIALHLSIETKEGWLGLDSLRVDMRVTTFYLGILDLLADLGISQNTLRLNNPTIDHILARYLVTSKAIGVHPVSFVYQRYEDLEEFEEWCRYEKAMGFEAKGCISPKQVEIVNRIFGVYDKKTALYIKERFEQMKKSGITGFRDERYGYIDEPIYKDALNILQKEV